MELVGDEVVVELVVRGPGDRLAPQLGHGLDGELAAEGGGYEDVGLGGERLGRVEPAGAEFVGEVAALGLDVGDREVGAGRGQSAGDECPDMAEADQGDPAVPEVGAPVELAAQCRQAGHNTGRGVR